jgi:hypothetical protein
MSLTRAIDQDTTTDTHNHGRNRDLNKQKQGDSMNSIISEARLPYLTTSACARTKGKPIPRHKKKKKKKKKS